MTGLYEQLERAAAHIADETGRAHEVALTLGSGLSAYADTLPKTITIPYAVIPHFPVPTVEGHEGSIVSAEIEGVGVLVLAGRSHWYEGVAASDLAFGVRTAVMAGCRTVILTNAAGGCGPGLAPGDLVVLTDHLNLVGTSPLIGPNDDRLGPRFPDMSEVYPDVLRQLVHQAAARAGLSVGEGVYAWFPGPAYETPAEVEMARRLGADLVGMSTVPEAVAAHHMGAGVIGISLVTNLAAGRGGGPLSHEEVTEMGRRAHDRFTAVVDQLLHDLAFEAQGRT